MKTIFTRFEFANALTRARRAPFSVPFLDLIILFGFSLYLSQHQYLKSQGMAVDLAPVSSQSEIIDSELCHGNLFIGINGMLFLNGERLSFDTLDQALVLLKNPARGSVRLLVQADRDVRVESFVRICDILRARGIETILVGVKPKTSFP